MATSAFLSPARRMITVKYGANCYLCQTQIFPGDLAFYPPGVEHLAGADCCGDKDDADFIPSLALEDQMSATEQNVPLELVMPRGKTKGDMCLRCFQIPSNSGACGCDA